MRPEIATLGLQLAAAGLIIGAIVSLLTGSAPSLGTSTRSALEPALSRIRHGSSLSRQQLADLSLLAAIGCSACAAIFDQFGVSVFMTLLLWLSRPAIQRVCREENRLLAIAGSLTTDLIIGLYVPIMAAQILIGHPFIAASMVFVVITLSWPAGGGSSVPGRTWKLSPVRA